jgi:hypothetical protein
MRRRFISALAAFVILATTGAGSIGLRRSESVIRESILALTPLGSSPEAVLTLVQKEKWKNQAHNKRSGFLMQQHGKKSVVVGTTHIQAWLGHHWTFPFLRTDVVAYWGFDADGRLVDVWIWKTINST